MLIAWLNGGGIQTKHFWSNHILGMVGVKWKGTVSVWNWFKYVTLTFDLDLRFFKVKFWNSCISGFVGLNDVIEKVANQLADYVTLPFDCTHDLGLCKGQISNNLISKWERQLM